MPIKKYREKSLTKSVISKHNCLIEIRDYLLSRKFTKLSNTSQPSWFREIRLILNKADYKL